MRAAGGPVVPPQVRVTAPLRFLSREAQVLRKEGAGYPIGLGKPSIVAGDDCCTALVEAVLG